MHRQGVVKLRFAVNAAGGVEDVQLLQGDPELARAAITALRQWRYSPLETDPASKPKAVKVLTLIFRLNSGVQALAAE
ncbi:MAG: energy transducer TonB [Aeromonadaceae bacterium]|nr:energy transducer TonB [Aeromonadaceae bacterium]